MYLSNKGACILICVKKGDGEIHNVVHIQRKTNKVYLEDAIFYIVHYKVKMIIHSIFCKTKELIFSASMKRGVNDCGSNQWTQWHKLSKVDIIVIKSLSCRLKQIVKIKLPKAQHYINKEMWHEYQWELSSHVQMNWMWSAFNNEKNPCMVWIENINRECVRDTGQPNQRAVNSPMPPMGRVFNNLLFIYILCWWLNIDMILIFTFFCRQTNDDLWTQILCVKCEELKQKCNI